MYASLNKRVDNFNSNFILCLQLIQLWKRKYFSLSQLAVIFWGRWIGARILECKLSNLLGYSKPIYIQPWPKCKCWKFSSVELVSGKSFCCTWKKFNKIWDNVASCSGEKFEPEKNAENGLTLSAIVIVIAHSINS